MQSWLSNPVIRLFLSNLAPNALTVNVVNTIARMSRVDVPDDVATAIAATATGVEGNYSSILEMIESPDVKPVFEMLFNGNNLLEAPMVICECPNCAEIFEAGAASTSKEI